MNEDGSSNTRLLLPASGLWISFSLLVSWLLCITPLSHFFWFPDFLALTLVYWNVREARRMPLFVPFICGLLMDVCAGNVLGQYALAYVILCWGGMKLQTRLPWFSYVGQVFHIFPLFLAVRIIILGVRIWAGGIFPGWEWFLPCVIDSLLWPLWGFILQIPQRRAGRAEGTTSL